LIKIRFNFVVLQEAS